MAKESPLRNSDFHVAWRIASYLRDASRARKGSTSPDAIRRQLAANPSVALAGRLAGTARA